MSFWGCNHFVRKNRLVFVHIKTTKTRKQTQNFSWGFCTGFWVPMRNRVFNLSNRWRCIKHKPVSFATYENNFILLYGFLFHPSSARLFLAWVLLVLHYRIWFKFLSIFFTTFQISTCFILPTSTVFIDFKIPLWIPNLKIYRHAIVHIVISQTTKSCIVPPQFLVFLDFLQLFLPQVYF